MTDEIDRANDEAERYLAEAARIKRPVGPQPNGRCHFCDEIVDDEARWCDKGCRDGWERNQRRVRA